MTKVVETPEADLYERDHYAWLEEQALLLREGRLEEIDAAHLIEEIEEVAANRQAEVESRAENVVEHLLKLEHSPADRPRRGWRLTVRRDRARLRKRLTASLRAHLASQLAELYRDACEAALIGLEPDHVDVGLIPAECPYTLDQILDPDWLPANRHGLVD